jgi:hypothetical protein
MQFHHHLPLLLVLASLSGCGSGNSDLDKARYLNSGFHWEISNGGMPEGTELQEWQNLIDKLVHENVLMRGNLKKKNIHGQNLDYVISRLKKIEGSDWVDLNVKTFISKGGTEFHYLLTPSGYDYLLSAE